MVKQQYAVPKSAPEAQAGIWVLAGANGAGKSSILGAFLREAGGDYYNPDEAALRLRSANPWLPIEEANALAWRTGADLLRAAIRQHTVFVLETTLGGETVTRLLEEAADAGLPVRIWYIGLADPELHVTRVASRVKRGGHDIPKQLIRRRFDQSRLHLIELIPRLTELKVYGNSTPADPAAGRQPSPQVIIHVRGGQIVAPKDLRATPAWAKPIVAAIIKALR